MEAARPLRLWELARELDEIAEALIEGGGELTPELGERLDAMAGQFEEKVENVALFIRECDANAAAAKVEEDRLAGIRKSFERKSSGLRDYLLFCMNRQGRDSVKTPRVRVRAQANSSPSIAYVGELEALPLSLVKLTRAVDMGLVREVLKAGNPLPDGFVVTEGRHIRIS